jgi:hypothetical protein
MKTGLMGAIALGLCVAGPAAGELSASLGLEYLHWEEDTTPTVTESGPLLALGLGYTQEKDSGLLFAYRGRAYLGEVDYDGAGLFTGTPIQGTTRYAGMANEGQLRWRTRTRQNYRADWLVALGMDFWERKLTSSQSEDYEIGYLRLGGEIDINEGKGWTAGAGVKYPFYTHEDAHLTNIGFDSNPTLKPGPDVSLFAHLGYRFTDSVSIIAYYDGFRFKKSEEEAVSHPVSGNGVIYQPASDLTILGLRLEYRMK